MPRLSQKVIAAGRVAAVGLLGVVACSTTGPRLSDRVEERVRFPAAPDPVRVVFLTTLEEAVGDLGDQTPLERFLFGRVDRSDASIITPYGIDVRNGVVYVTDTQQGFVHGFDLKNDRRFKLGSGGEGRTQEPVDVAVATDGTCFVADTVRKQVVVFDPARKFLRTLGGPGSSGWSDAEDAFKPVSVAVNGDRLAVANAALNRLEVYRVPDGSLERTITSGAGDTGTFQVISGVAFDDRGNLYATDSLQARVHVFGVDGQPLRSFGKPGSTLGRLARPRRICVGADQVLYIADALFHHVHLFNDQGRMLMFVGGAGQTPGCTNEVADAACDASLIERFARWIPTGFQAQYLIFVTNQLGPGQVNVYAFGEMAGAAP